LGEVKVPSKCLWGAQTQRSIENFKIGDNERMPLGLIHSMGIIKLAAARVNAAMGKLPNDISSALIQASEEVVNGKHDSEFPLVVW
jgi:fumarate hydratase, class II